MCSKLNQILMLTAWLLATGAHWDVVQTFAWSRMLVNNARVLPLRDALEFTFSAEGRCNLCQTVQENRPAPAGEDAAVVNLMTKEPLVFQTLASVVVSAPAATICATRAASWMSHERTAPPSPPPRGLA